MKLIVKMLLPLHIKMNKETLTKELFTTYGLLVYLIQVIEKKILSLILSDNLKNNITQSRYDELLYEKSQLTLGQLKRDLKNTTLFLPRDLEKIERFHKKRDFLIHSYWWTKAVEIETAPNSLLHELKEFQTFFDEINSMLELKTLQFYIKNDINLDEIANEMISEGVTPSLESFRPLKKNETLIDLFKYQNAIGSIIPIFQLEDKTYWTVCEIGLTQYKKEIIPANKTVITKVQSIFPIKQFNPRPKINALWNYNLDLKKQGLKVKIGFENGSMKWGII